MELQSNITASFPSLKDQVAIVTGSGRGIGAGIAEYLGRQGMRIVLTSPEEAEGLEMRKTLRNRGIDCHWVTADLSIRDQAVKVVEEAKKAYGSIDCLVNNAAVLDYKGILDLDESAYHRTFELNCRILYQITHLVVAHMVENRRGGGIINISSVGGLRPQRESCGYVSAKGAMNAMTCSMAIDLAPKRIRVNAIAPGAIRSTECDDPEYEKTLQTGAVPMGRLGVVEEIGAVAAFLASDAAAYITGQILYVDGGLTSQLVPSGINI